MSTADDSPGPLWHRKRTHVGAFPPPELAAGPRAGRARRAILAAALLAVALVLGGCGAFSSYAAEVNGERITQEELRAELNAILDNKEYLERVDEAFTSSSGGQEKAKGEGKGTFNTVFVAAVLDRRIGFTLIHQEVERRKLKVPADLVKKTRADLEENYTKAIFEAFPADYRDDLVRIFAEQTVLTEALGTSVDDAAVREFYEENKAAFDQTGVRHILVADKAKADVVKARLDAGEDFAAIATAESTDNQGEGGGSAGKGGDLGCVAANAFVPEFEAAMNTLEPGQIGGPVQTQFGFHVIEVIERKTLSLAEATEQIRENLQGQDNPLQSYVNAALAKAEIKVNPRYGRFVKTPEDAGVRAPKLLEPSTTTTVPAESELQIQPGQ